MKIIIGSDHRGYHLKEVIKKHFNDYGWHDVGTDDEDKRVDYPVFAKAACEEVLEGVATKAILICGSGVGMSIAANRFKKVYAALCWSPDVARAAKENDNANALVLPADFISDDLAVETVEAWLNASFKDGLHHDAIHQKRLDMIDESM